MRLYRAMAIGEEILTSNVRAFKDDEITDKLNLINEMYSHIIKSSNNSYAHDRKIIFSFTDDINKAINILNKYSEYYDRIGYIDVDFLGFGTDDKIKWVWPVYRIEDWVKALYYLDYNFLTYQTLNFRDVSMPKNIVNTLILSRSGVCSYASVFNEYHIICRDLKPTIINDKQIKTESDIKQDLIDIPILDQYRYNQIGNKLLRDLVDVDCQEKSKLEVRKRILSNMNIK